MREKYLLHASCTLLFISSVDRSVGDIIRPSYVYSFTYLIILLVTMIITHANIHMLNKIVNYIKKYYYSQNRSTVNWNLIQNCEPIKSMIELVIKLSKKLIKFLNNNNNNLLIINLFNNNLLI